MLRNHLAEETSPSLLQHGGNPVDGYPWGELALARALRENKPILLSIGYSACHWCHVMAHESFEDLSVAAVMNELFINIKVDREERPDLDKIYQVAQQMLTHGPGGWPLTLFLAPEKQEPFFGGTYFPKEPRFGLPGFGDLLRRVAQYYRQEKAQIASQNAQLEAALTQLVPQPARGVVLDESPLSQARAVLEQSFDADFGGFTRAPKFPHPNSIELCMRHWYRSSSNTSPDLKALYMGSLTLTRMAQGGLYDQLGGGFARYSVDGAWMIPHFEKMLYDNAQLLCEYSRAHLARNRRLGAARHALTRRRLLLEPGCGFPRSRREILCLDAGRGIRVVDRAGIRGIRAALRFGSTRQLRGPVAFAHPCPDRRDCRRA